MSRHWVNASKATSATPRGIVDTPGTEHLSQILAVPGMRVGLGLLAPLPVFESGWGVRVVVHGDPA